MPADTADAPVRRESEASSTFAGLRRFNLSMAALHAVQGVLMLALSNDFALPVTTAFLRYDATSDSLDPRLDTVAELRIGPLVAAFLFVSAIAHLVVSLPRVFGWYTDRLGRGANYARWAEYSVSSSLMMVVIGMLVGIYDVAALILLFALNATMIMFGWVMELHHERTGRADWTSYAFGCFAGAVPWVAVAIYLVGAGNAPTFVYWIYVSIFVAFNVFAVNMLLQYRRIGPWRDYLYWERAYIVLSLVAKSLLAWQVFAGTLRPN